MLPVVGGQMALVLIVFVTHKRSGSKESLASFYHVLLVTHALPLLATRSLRASHRSASHRHAAPHRIALSQMHTASHVGHNYSR